MLVYIDPGLDTCSGFTLLVVCDRLLHDQGGQGKAMEIYCGFTFALSPQCWEMALAFVLYMQK